jgi:isopentenyl-diphosphate delta-isomerase
MAKNLWQQYDEQGRPLAGPGIAKAEAFGQGILHAASHVWIWRLQNGNPEVLLQKRAADKASWPNHYDISAAGHIDLGEDALTAAIRETQEEIGIDVPPEELFNIGIHRAHLQAPGLIENEFQWLYLYQLQSGASFTLQADEVATTQWVALEDFRSRCQSDDFVPHGSAYFGEVITALEYAAKAVV